MEEYTEATVQSVATRYHKPHTNLLSSFSEGMTRTDWNVLKFLWHRRWYVNACLWLCDWLTGPHVWPVVVRPWWPRWLGDFTQRSRIYVRPGHLGNLQSRQLPDPGVQSSPVSHGGNAESKARVYTVCNTNPDSTPTHSQLSDVTWYIITLLFTGHIPFSDYSQCFP